MEKSLDINTDTTTIRFALAVLAAGVFLLVSCQPAEPVKPAGEEAPAVESTEGTTEKFKVLHIMSYHAEWPWNQDQFRGFQDGLGGLDAEYKVFEMDTKRHNSPEWMERVGQEARDLIDTWKPDLVYTNDDNAQEYVAKHYVDTDIPFVFGAVNAAPETYGFAGSTNVTGVLEQEHFVESVRLLKEIAPDVEKIAVIVDVDPMWEPVVARMKDKQSQLPDVEFISWDVILTYEEYQQKVTEYQNTADALGLIGIFGFKDESGENVPYQDVLKWTAEHSNLPDFTYWEDRIKYGTLCTVTVSWYEQGLAAGKIARGILVEGQSPSSYPMEPTVKGEPVVSLARAKQLGLSIKSDILLTAHVMEQFEWEK
jgi:ABC-type uncharacterized transport system substrate-binding protein